MKHNRIAMMAFILIQLFAGASQLKAQFRIVDEQDGKPVSGAYVFSSKGTLLCNDFVTTDVKTMTKEEAKAEMKNHSETDQFTLPDCLPAIPYDVAAETKDLLKKSFWEM